MKADYHLHTEFSDDSEAPMEDVVERAIRLGLDEICFTDHVDYGIKRDWDDARELPWIQALTERNVNYPLYFNKIDALSQRYRSRITLRRGLEFGVQARTTALYSSLFKKYRDQFDFVLLSVHEIDDLEFWSQDFQRGKEQEEYNLRYYQELLAIVERFKDYSVLAHLDLLSRYDRCGIYPFEKIRDLVAAILEQAIRDDKGLELNTSSWRYNLPDTCPNRNILRLYRDLGGRILTIGSDAHDTSQIADHFSQARDILRNELGFQEFCTFNKMTPCFHRLQ